MGGNTDNAAIWPDADVYVAFDLDEPNPADETEDFGAGWDLLGLLDGGQGFVESRNEDVTEHYAWGGILVRTARKNFRLTRQFTALENNTATRRLAWPGSAAGERKVPRLEKVKVAFEIREGDKVARVITRNYAEITVNADIVDKEDDLTKYPFLVTVYPDADGVLFDEQPEEVASV